MEGYDLVIRGARYLNLFTKEAYTADIGISDGKIAYVTPPGSPPLCGREVYDAAGKTAIPGLIDTHVHIESSLMGPAGFCGAVVPHGTTTVLADPHEIANVMGLPGIDYMLAESEGLPLQIFLLAPSCVPSVVGLETSKTVFDAPEITRMLENARVIGLGEVMDYPGVINGDGRMKRVLEAAARSGKFIQGHAPNVTGTDLAAYMYAGCESDHESHTPEEAAAKLRAGLTLECRHASNCHDVSALARTIIDFHYPETVTFCTDDREPSDLLKEGHLDEAVRAAIRAGMDPLEAVKIATVNAARLARLRDRGCLRPGCRADLLLLDDLETVAVNEVFIGGRLVAKNGRMMEPPARVCVDAPDTIRLGQPLIVDDFRFRAAGPEICLHTICYDESDRFVTKLGAHTFPVADGHAQINRQEGFATFAALERHGINGNRSVAPVKGCGLRAGAVATTVSHDSHNLFVLGKSEEEMLLAAQTVELSKGGICCVRDGKVACHLELPIAGLMSGEPLEVLAAKTTELQNTLREMGIEGDSPMMIIASFALAVIPEVRLTDVGLADTVHQKIIPPVAEP